MQRQTLYAIVGLLLVVAVGGFLAARAANLTFGSSPSRPVTTLETPVTLLPLAGRIADQDAEISGLAWFEDTLIAIPQYPELFDNHVFAFEKSDIRAALEYPTLFLESKEIILDTGGLEREIKDYEGFEAIAFDGDRVVMTIESGSGPGQMIGYIVWGRIDSSTLTITLEPLTLTPIRAQAFIDNYTEEAIIISDGKVMTIYEANGASIVVSPVAHAFSMDGSALPDIPLSNIEFRITDATDVDAEGRFWAINYNFYVAGNRIPIDPLFESYGYGPTHAESYVVERLVAFDITSSGIVLADQPPIQLKLIEAARNWEGIVQLDDSGFLIATDKFPDTMLGFVPLPQGSR